MKTYRNLWSEIISDNNIELAIKESCKSRKKNMRKRKQLESLKNNKDNIKIVREWIENYKCRKCTPKIIYDGICKKKRFIYVPTVKETVVQHAIVQVLDKYLGRSFYEHSYAAIKGKGAHKAKKVIERWIRTKPNQVKYYLKLDIKKYFPSIPQDILISKLSKQIKDEKTMEIIKDILGACDHGIPLGYYISQWIANYYLTDYDHWLKENYDVLYIRWMDDMVIFNSNKRQLHRLLNDIEKYLEDNLGLKVKDDWKICRFCYGEKSDKKKCRGKFLDFMGFRFYRNRTTIRESIFYRIIRKARKINKKTKPTIHEIRQFLSYLGWIKHTDTYKAYENYVKPYVNIQKFKRRVSNYERRRHELSNSTWNTSGKAA